MRRNSALAVFWALCFALVSGRSVATAQQPACAFFKVNTSLLNISDKAGSKLYIDVAEDGEIACVSQQANVEGVDWAFVPFKLNDARARIPVEGWAMLRDMTRLSPAEMAALEAGAAPAPAATAKPPAAPAPPAVAATPAPASPAAPAPARPQAAAPKAVAPTAPAATAMRAEDVLRFDQPILFGAFPVNGNSIQQMIASDKPLFSPVEGLEEAVWEKPCAECHKWNQERMCEQGKTYIKAPRNVLRVKHPFGGTFKIALMRWAKSGCE